MDRLLMGLSMNPVRFLRMEGYPLRIIGNGGQKATLVGMQHLSGGHAGISTGIRGGAKPSTDSKRSRAAGLRS